MHILDEELYQAGMAIAACPTAPCHEGHVRACLLERLRDLPHVTTRLDEFGNLHAAYDHKSADREPFRVVAHMDHPAFVVARGQKRRSGTPLRRRRGRKSISRARRSRFTTRQRGNRSGAPRSSRPKFTEEVKRVTIDRSDSRRGDLRHVGPARGALHEAAFHQPGLRRPGPGLDRAGAAAAAGAGGRDGPASTRFSPARRRSASPARWPH